MQGIGSLPSHLVNVFVVEVLDARVLSVPGGHLSFPFGVFIVVGGDDLRHVLSSITGRVNAIICSVQHPFSRSQLSIDG